MDELSDMYMLSADDLAVEETGKTGGVSVGDFSLANKHEPLDASRGARIMAKEVGISSSCFLKYEKFIVVFTSKAAISYSDRHNMR